MVGDLSLWNQVIFEKCLVVCNVSNETHPETSGGTEKSEKLDLLGAAGRQAFCGTSEGVIMIPAAFIYNTG